MADHNTDTVTLRVELTHEQIDVGEAYAFLPGPEAGGIAVFVGTTRQWTGADETTSLFYEAYEPMARAELTRLGEEAATRWPVGRCMLVHRLGEVPVGQASVLVGVATAHRAEAFEACRWLIDTLKENVPIWKRDTAPSGQRAWVRPLGGSGHKSSID